MKRTGDDVYTSESHLKHPLVSSQNDLNVRKKEVLEFLKEVKKVFGDQEKKYNRLCEVMLDFKTQRIDRAAVIAEVKELFKGYNSLVFGFNIFLPKGYEIKITEEDVAKKTLEEARSFVMKVKEVFKDQQHKYNRFLEVVLDFKTQRIDRAGVIAEVKELFKGHNSLLHGFNIFLPEGCEIKIIEEDVAKKTLEEARSFAMEKECQKESNVSPRGDNNDLIDETMAEMQKEMQNCFDEENIEMRGCGNDRESSPPQIRHMQMETECQRENDVASWSDTNVDHDDLNTDETMAEMQKEVCKCVDEENIEMSDRDLDDREEEQENLHIVSENCKSLTRAFAGTHVAESSNSEELLSGSTKVKEKGKKHKSDVDAVKETEKNKKKYMGKSIQDLDLSHWECCTPSYRLLPSDYPIPTASERSELEAEVLNDRLVCFKDYSSEHMRKNQYEEILFKCEDDRFELEMLMESVSSAAKRAETLLNVIGKKQTSLSTSFKIEDHFTVQNLRCIERLYGDHGLDVIDTLRKNPADALPVILTRLKKKYNEWKKYLEDMEKFWASAFAKYHYKSLDHKQGPK